MIRSVKFESGVRAVTVRTTELLTHPIQVAFYNVIRELFFPNTRRQINGLAGQILTDVLQDIDDIGVRVDTLSDPLTL